MKIEQVSFTNSEWVGNTSSNLNPQLCLLFGSRPTIESNPQFFKSLKERYPNADIITTSTAGNIFDDKLIDDSIVATCIEFEKTKVKTKSFLIETDSELLGATIANYFNTEDLTYLLLLSNMGVNAGNILNGINSVFKGKVFVSGGIAGDDTRFEKTLVGINENIGSNELIAIGFYGTNLVVSHGSKGGWDKFGPIRKVTKCKGNVLYEIDNKPVLDLYKEYLGEKAKQLPASGLLFPFAIIDNTTNEPVVRGIQNVNELENSIILYGDVIEGQNIQLMRANFDGLINGAGLSAKETFLNHSEEPDLAILISCVARRLVLGQLTEEELEEAKKNLGPNTKICGFYSYSELSPVVGDKACHLHNQTMTITTLSEI